MSTRAAAVADAFAAIATQTDSRLHPKSPGVPEAPADTHPHVPAGHPSIFPLHPRFTWLETGETTEVCVTVTTGHVAIIARDALAAAGLPVIADLAIEPECAFAVGSATSVAEHAHATAWGYTMLLDVFAVRAEDARPAAFLRWLHERMNELAAYGLHRLSAEVTRAAYARTPDGVPVKVPEVFSVRQSARILDRDPSISIGQIRLFEYLCSIGWIERSHAGVWVARPHVRTDGLLTTQHVAERHFSHDEPYPQLILTVPGVLELQRRLGGTAALDFTPHPTLALDEE